MTLCVRHDRVMCVEVLSERLCAHDLTLLHGHSSYAIEPIDACMKRLL